MQTPREIINEWLDRIGACEAERAEVIEQCVVDKDVRQFYLKMALGIEQ